jgi:hypothetical protein
VTFGELAYAARAGCGSVAKAMRPIWSAADVAMGRTRRSANVEGRESRVGGEGRGSCSRRGPLWCVLGRALDVSTHANHAVAPATVGCSDIRKIPASAKLKLYETGRGQSLRKILDSPRVHPTAHELRR